MNPRILSISLAALAASAASAQLNIPRVFSEVSTDNAQTWSSSASVNPGETVLVRIRIRLENPEAQVLGFAGMTCQPTVSNWDAARDVALSLDAPRGRVFPFTSVTQSPSSASGPLTSFVDPGNTLRWAGANNITMTTNLGWGVNMAQLTPQLAGTNFAFGTDVTTFVYGIVPGDTGSPRTLLATVPLAGVQNARTSWIICFNCTASLLATLTAGSIVPAEIHVIPAPHALSLTIIASGILSRRRHRSQP